MKQKIFFNPMIRYMFLNALKLNLTVMITYRRSADEPLSIILASLILFLVLATPILLSKVIYARQDSLAEIKNKKAFGTVY